MTRQDFINELIRRFTDSVTEKMPDFREVQATDDPNSFVCTKGDDFYFAHILPPGEPIVTFRKATKQEIVKDDEQDSDETEQDDKELPFYPVRKGDEFYCFNPVSVSDMNGHSYIAYSKGKTYVSEQDDCITDDQGNKGHIWTPDGYGMLVGNFMRKTKEAPILITKGSWVVRGGAVCCVDEVVDRDKVMIIVPSLFGGIKTLCHIKEVHPWTMKDAKRGDYLYCDDGDKRKVIYISDGQEDVIHYALAGYNAAIEHFWMDEICCLDHPERLRPATDEEKYLLNTIIDRNGYHWNLDSLQLEEKPRHIVDVRPASYDRYEKVLAELEQQRLMIDELNEKVEKLQKEG